MTAHSSRPVWLGKDSRGWDHCRVHVQLLHDPRLGAYELAVYFGLAFHAEVESGASRPAAETLAGYTNMGERRVRDSLAILEGAGYIRMDRRVGLASIVHLLAPPVLPRQEMPGSESEGPVSDAGGAGSRGRATPARGPDEQEPTTRTKNEDPPNPPQAGGRSSSSPRAMGTNPRGPRPTDPIEAIQAASHQRAERNAARLRGEACPTCDGCGVVETGAGVVYCRACA